MSDPWERRATCGVLVWVKRFVRFVCLGRRQRCDSRRTACVHCAVHVHVDSVHHLHSPCPVHRTIHQRSLGAWCLALSVSMGGVRNSELVVGFGAHCQNSTTASLQMGGLIDVWLSINMLNTAVIHEVFFCMICQSNSQLKVFPTVRKRSGAFRSPEMPG